MIKPIKKRGFTLVEMLVSISIFVLVAFTVTGTLIAVSSANRKAQELKQIIDNLNFSVQSMVLRMREGTDYTCASSSNVFNTLPQAGGKKCESGEGDAIVFLDPTPQTSSGSPVTVKYYLAEVTINNGVTKRILKVDGLAGGAQGLDVTSPEVDITELNFIVGGTSGTGKPYVIVSISGFAKLRSGERSEFNLQTVVSQHK